MTLSFMFNIKGEPQEWNPGAMYFYNGKINVIQGIHNEEELKYLENIYNDTRIGADGSSSYSSAGGGSGKDPGSLHYGQYNLSSAQLGQIISGCNKMNILPSFAICILLHESLWGASSVGRADNNWGGMTWTGNPQRPSGVRVSVGQGRAEGGNYMHYNSLQDFIVDWCYLLVHGGYKVAGVRDLGTAVRGMFRVGGAAYDYAAAGYDSYWGAVSRIKSGLDAANGNIDRFNNGEYGGTVTTTSPTPPLKAYGWTNKAPVYRRIFGVLQPGSREAQIKAAIEKIKKSIDLFIDVYGTPTWFVSQQQMWIREEPGRKTDVIGYTKVSDRYNILDTVTMCDYHWAKIEIDVGDKVWDSNWGPNKDNPGGDHNLQDMGATSHIYAQQFRVGDIMKAPDGNYYRITSLSLGPQNAGKWPWGSYTIEYCGDGWKPSTHKQTGWTAIADILDNSYALFGR